MGQLGFLLLFALPIALAFGKTSLFAIPIAFFMVIGMIQFVKVREHRYLLYARGALSILTGGIALVSLSRLTFQEIQAASLWPIGVLLFLAMLLMGKVKKGHRIVTPGENGMKEIWTKVMVVLLIILILGQITNLNAKGAFFEKGAYGILWNKSDTMFRQGYRIVMGAILQWLVISGCFLTELGGCAIYKENRSLIKKESVIFATYYLIYSLLMLVFPYEVLTESQIPFFLLGRSAAVGSGSALRIEILVKYILWIGLFFALWDSVKYGILPMLHRFDKDKTKRLKKCGILMLTVAMLLGMTGCGEEPIRKDFLIAADSAVILKQKAYEDEKKQKSELSHLKILVINEKDDLKRVVENILRRSEISLQTHVVYSEEDIVQKVSENKEKLTEQLRKSTSKNKATILQLLYCVYGGEELRIPKVKLSDGKMKENGTVLIKNGKIWK